MPLFTKAQLINRAQPVISNFAAKSANEVLEKSRKSVDNKEDFDIFLCHRYLDGLYILGLKTEFEDMGYSVFVDWVENPLLDRSCVSPSTANWLRKTIRKSKSLLYAITENSADSKWMPWELGYSDGVHGKVAVVPIANSDVSTEYYQGQEYLSIYPYVTKTRTRDSNRNEIWINKSPEVYITMRRWLTGEVPVVYHGN
jgi:hypothetical protein